MRKAMSKQIAMIKAMRKVDTKKMKKADTKNLENLERLKESFPAAWDDLKKRYRAPEGKLWREGDGLTREEERKLRLDAAEDIQKRGLR